MMFKTIQILVRDKGKGAPTSVLEFSNDALGTLGVGLRGMSAGGVTEYYRKRPNLGPTQTPTPQPQ